MAEAGYHRTGEQIRVHWKSLKAAYYKNNKHNSTSGSNHAILPHFNILNEILSHRPLATASDHGLDIRFQTQQNDANDGDSSAQGEGNVKPYVL